ncbi:hypothetical protein [Butyrivibrio sp. LC3010]|uniref:hypothetical protein n=1 Tax=Butyrivibrio sp. LC3010 TaxID=1280680 RepID=UPI0004244CC3|nr:hypothetical protein [Butyrivibrio sp. LC3010]
MKKILKNITALLIAILIITSFSAPIPVLAASQNGQANNAYSYVKNNASKVFGRNGYKWGATYKKTR